MGPIWAFFSGRIMQAYYARFAECLSMVLIVAVVSSRCTWSQDETPSLGQCIQALERWSHAADGCRLLYRITHGSNETQNSLLNVTASGSTIENTVFESTSNDVFRYTRIDRVRQRSFAVQRYPYGDNPNAQFIVTAGLRDDIARIVTGTAVGVAFDAEPLFRKIRQGRCRVRWDNSTGKRYAILTCIHPRCGTYTIRLDPEKFLFPRRVHNIRPIGAPVDTEDAMPPGWEAWSDSIVYRRHKGTYVVSSWVDGAHEVGKNAIYRATTKLIDLQSAAPVPDSLVVPGMDIPNGIPVNAKREDQYINYAYRDGTIVKLVDTGAIEALKEVHFQSTSGARGGLLWLSLVAVTGLIVLATLVIRTRRTASS